MPPFVVRAAERASMWKASHVLTNISRGLLDGRMQLASGRIIAFDAARVAVRVYLTCLASMSVVSPFRARIPEAQMAREQSVDSIEQAEITEPRYGGAFVPTDWAQRSSLHARRIEAASRL